jgi:hypothetical protein
MVNIFGFVWLCTFTVKYKLCTWQQTYTVKLRGRCSRMRRRHRPWSGTEGVHASGTNSHHRLVIQGSHDLRLRGFHHVRAQAELKIIVTYVMINWFAKKLQGQLKIIVK